MTWFNMKHYLLLSFLTFKFLDWSRATSLPLWDLLSYILVLGASYWLGFVTYRYLKRYNLAFQVASYKKAIVITGCDTGFGNMLARRLAPRGFQVLAGCLNPSAPEATILETVPNVSVFPLDVTSEGSLREALDIVSTKLKESGHDLWCVVCNAGICEVGELEWQSIMSIERTLDVNVMGSIRTIRTFLPTLRASKGRIVLCASVLSNISSPGFVAYSMSKAAIASLGEGLKRELQDWDVNVCTVQPALYKTGLLRFDQVKNDFFSAQLNMLSEHVRSDYGHEYFIAFWNTIAKFFEKHANPYPEQAVDVLYHAITTVWPETHYRAGSWKQLILYNLLDYLPTEVVDLMFDKIMKPPVLPNAVMKS